VVDVNVGFAEPGGRSCQLAGPVWKLDLGNLPFGVCQALAIQDRLGCGSSESDCVLKNEHREKNRLTSLAPQACLP
ncbi:MAG TPA: hypothetical protein VN648_19030, partial [Candidatus Methylomirabilis sp.]|nr:hypothetical protein [Candidatus Methylomirabilis sp.]